MLIDVTSNPTHNLDASETQCAARALSCSRGQPKLSVETTENDRTEDRT